MMEVMKKQFRYREYDWYRCICYLYHDGKLIDKKIIDASELSDYVDILKIQGYTKGFVKDEVEEAEKIYKNKLENIIEEN